MYKILKNLIETNTRTLRDLESRIAWQVANGGITAEEADELMALAAAQAAPPDVPENTEMAVRLGTVEATVAMLTGRVDALTARLDAGETGTGDEPGDGEDGEDGGDTPVGPPAGVEAWNPANAYMYGASVWYDGYVWVSQEGNNRFTPGVHAWAWKAVQS